MQTSKILRFFLENPLSERNIHAKVDKSNFTLTWGAHPNGGPIWHAHRNNKQHLASAGLHIEKEVHRGLA